ncbi:hypothetical protein [Sulfoacidibacillus thermotolerans]|uniref:Uncharacterized protein n=1 Tax=Sulfoacidibacillus thermotolerans TaxID=1765684 RepID=A0A2U3DB14_SULT2|nr:hypothetical protein [Sulfoacidibacillus thermotolerans]PWI58471.1 hypothetical protein BM613_02810 [Sulfoacidibacillus thermotolerans]
MWTVQDTFTKFVYPFWIDFDEDFTFEQAAEKIARFFIPFPDEEHKIPLWVECQFQTSELDNMLPYVKRYMRLPQNQRRFRIHEDILPLFDDMQTTSMEASSPGFQMSSIELYLFFNGVGFLTIEIAPNWSRADEISVEWIENINADLASLARCKPMRQRHPKYDLSSVCSSGALLPLMCGQPGTMREWIHHLLSPLAERLGTGCWQPMCDTFLPIYGALLLRRTESLSSEEPNKWDASFREFALSHLIVLRKTLPSNNGSRFARQTFEDSQYNYMPYHNVIHTQSLEGGFVLAYDTNVQHFRGRNSAAMQSFRTNYFYMMLLALHQRMSILRYAMKAAEASTVPDHAKQLRQLREQIYDFTARCYFSQASFSEERDQLYRRWQRAFHIVQMYNELKEEVHDIDGYLEQVAKERELETKERELRQEAKKTQLVTYISFILLPLSVLSNLIQASPIIMHWLNFSLHPLRSSLLLLIAAFGAILLLRILWKLLSTPKDHN